MAAAVDNFEHLSKEIANVFTSVNDTFAAIGAYYVGTKTIGAVAAILNAVGAHFISRIAPINLKNKFGKWAVVTGCSEGIGKAYAQELASHGINLVMISKPDQPFLEKVAKEIVVTGCTEGIGRAFCHELASQGLNLLLLSRNQGKLDKLANEFEEQFHIEVATCPVDFTHGHSVYNTIREAIGDKNIGILVNNVGVMYSYPQYFLDVPEEKLWQLVYVNVIAATIMTHMVMPQMVKRGRGAVINISSGSCLKPTPQMTAYSATKSYLDYLSYCLEYEYRSSGVIVQCLTPYYVATRMTAYSETLSTTNFFIPSASVYARHALKTLGWARKTTGYWPHTLQHWLLQWIPDCIYMWGATRLNIALRRQAEHRKRHRSGRGSLYSGGSPSSSSLSDFASISSHRRPSLPIDGSSAFVSPTDPATTV
ncbi:inactive hydroxysteroid dehydrogenase-like protein 1 isoform X1 [Tubulanus polymorphus]|uniref:inactive hydroxysteroid dehydrogenase-like protein 1 isoform X1 n=1 Tax=Tubulanus polymorphus TaxID=672921 RepID=UPI003DA37FEC